MTTRLPTNVAQFLFVVISAIYYGYFSFTGPVVPAVVFLGVVIALDVFVVALPIQREFTMFRSVLGQWPRLP